MEQFNDNYFETPFAKNLEEFETYYKDSWKDRLSDKEMKIMQEHLLYLY